MPAQLQLLLVQGRRREFLPSSHSRHSDASFVSSSTIQVRVRVRPITRLAGGAPEQARADSPPAQAERRAEAQQQLLDRQEELRERVARNDEVCPFVRLFVRARST